MLRTCLPMGFWALRLHVHTYSSHSLWMEWNTCVHYCIGFLVQQIHQMMSLACTPLSPTIFPMASPWLLLSIWTQYSGLPTSSLSSPTIQSYQKINVMSRCLIYFQSFMSIDTLTTMLRFNLMRVEICELRPEVLAESDGVLVHYRSRTNGWRGLSSKTLA